MANDGPGTGREGESAEAGAGPLTLAQLQGTEAEVVGSDGKKVGDLKIVGDADLVVGRTLRSDLHVPVRRVREVTADDKVVLNVSADEAQKAQPSGSSTDTSDHPEGFSPSEEQEKGALGLVRDDTQETK